MEVRWSANILNASPLSTQCTQLLLLCRWTSQKRSNVAHGYLPISPQCPQHQHYSQHLYLHMGSLGLLNCQPQWKTVRTNLYFSLVLFSGRILSQILLRKLMVTRNDPHTPPLPPQQFASRMFSKDPFDKVWSFTWGYWKMVGTLRGEAGTGVCLKGMIGTGYFLSSVFASWLQWSKWLPAIMHCTYQRHKWGCQITRDRNLPIYKPKQASPLPLQLIQIFCYSDEDSKQLRCDYLLLLKIENKYALFNEQTSFHQVF